MSRLSKQRHFSLSRLFPNMVTLMALCCGLTSIRFALNENWKYSVLFIVAAILLDGMDGRLARLLKSTSNFGAQLDSLCDFLSFGIAPGLVLYLWKLGAVKGFGWAIVMVFAVCCALRLARFNTGIFEEPDKAGKPDNFFTGVPAPCAAGFAIIPFLVYFEFGEGFYTDPKFLIGYMALVAFLMVSRIPTISVKRLKVRHDMALPIMIAAGTTIAMMIIEPWLTMIGMGIIYASTLPLGIILHRRSLRAEAGSQGKAYENNDKAVEKPNIHTFLGRK